MSADGNTVIVGAIGNDGNGSTSGHARIYDWDAGTSAWVQRGLDLDGEVGGDQSGWSVSMSADGNTVIVGASLNDGNGSASGHARIYDWDAGTSAWVQRGSDINGEALGDESGFSVSMSADGNTVIVGARYNDGNGSDSGHARIYRATGGAVPTFEWAVSGGGTSSDEGFGIAVDASGNTYVTGYYNGTADFGATTLTSAGSNDTFVAKLDPSGNYLWAVSGGGTDSESGSAIAVDAGGNVYVMGVYNGTADFGATTLMSAGASDTFVAKLDSSGNYLWAVSGGGTSIDDGFGIAVDATGNAYVTGYYNGTADFGATTLTSAGSNDSFVAKLDPSGNYLWAVSGGGTNSESGSAVAVDASGNAYVTGSYSGTADLERRS